MFSGFKSSDVFCNSSSLVSSSFSLQQFKCSLQQFECGLQQVKSSLQVWVWIARVRVWIATVQVWIVAVKVWTAWELLLSSEIWICHEELETVLLSLSLSMSSVVGTLLLFFSLFFVIYNLLLSCGHQYIKEVLTLNMTHTSKTCSFKCIWWDFAVCTELPLRVHIGDVFPRVLNHNGIVSKILEILICRTTKNML